MPAERVADLCRSIQAEYDPKKRAALIGNAQLKRRLTFKPMRKSAI